jgi:hypothetical protein
MTIVQMQSPVFHWNGHSSDVRPISGTTEGSTFHFVDTGERSIFHNGMWEEDLRWIYVAKNV